MTNARKQIESYTKQEKNKLRHVLDKMRGAYKTYEWVMKNKDSFKMNVFGPVALEIRQLTDKRYAKFVGNVVPKFDFSSSNAYFAWHPKIQEIA